MARAKTIQIFLPGGDPRGVRIAELTTQIVQVIEVPRSLLEDFLKMPESGQVALYFLLAQAEEGEDPKVYIGQSGELRTRLASHNKTKEFWQRALVLVSKTNSLTQTHALFLEWHCLQAVRKAGRYADENGNAGSRPHTPPPLEAECHDIFETGSTLLSTLGFPMFDAVVPTKTSAVREEIFHCAGKGVDGRGLYTTEGFVVLKGSVGRRANRPSIIGTANERFRQKLLTSRVMKADGEAVVFTKDYLFSSPSAAAMALLGVPSNGWKAWKDASGRSLAEVKRDSAVAEAVEE